MSARGSEALSYRGEDGLLHLWECAHVLRIAGPEVIRCGYISHGPGDCPYPHDGGPVAMVPITALVLCSDCQEPIERDDGRAPDNRLICGSCTLNYIGSGGYVTS